MGQLATVELRRLEVTKRLLLGESVRQIAAALGASRPAIGRDVQALRAEWARARVGAVEQIAGEQLERVRVMLSVLWPKVLAGNGEAIDRAARLIELQARLARTIAPPSALPELPAGSAARISVEVEYAPDWRSARKLSGEPELGLPEPPELPAPGVRDVEEVGGGAAEGGAG